MTDGSNMGGPPENEQPGYGAPTPPPGQPGVPTPPMPPQPGGYPPQAPTPPPAPGYPGAQVPAQPNPYGVPPQMPTAGGYQAPYGQEPKKRKVWLWVMLGILIPLMLCGLGVAGCTIWVVSETKPAVDATNKFYKAAKNGEDLEKYTCKEYLDQGGDFRDDMDNFASLHGEIDTYDFNKVDKTSGRVKELYGNTAVGGTVTRDGKDYDAVVYLEKEGGKYKVCNLAEI